MKKLKNRDKLGRAVHEVTQFLVETGAPQAFLRELARFCDNRARYKEPYVVIPNKKKRAK